MKQSNKIYFWSIVIALGGFLFGFDTAVISGAEQAIQHYWSLNDFQLGLTVSIALIGTVIGSLLGSIPSDRLGRKKTLFFIAILYLLASLGTALSTSWGMFMVLRFAGGLGVGVSCVIAPIYISELSPAESRGKMVALFQFNVVLGILLAYISNYFIGYWFQGNMAWRFMLGIQTIPSLIFLITIRLIPESPRWLILNRNKVKEATLILAQVSPGREDKIVSDILTHKGNIAHVTQESLWDKKYRIPLILAVMIAFFNQASGINAIIYYAPRIFEMTGLGKGASLLSTAGVGLVNFIFTLIAMNLIDRVGRRKLMLFGSIGLIITLGLVSRIFFTQNFGNMEVVVLLLVYIAFFAFSQGAVIWVFISEIFPNQVRAKGQSLGSFTHWIMATLIAFSFPYLAKHVGGGKTFFFFACVMVLQLIFVIRFMPETKGKSLEQIELYVPLIQ
ncbi:MAG: sugar porter family MFS transporter [Chitinophagaceae bacterium]